MERGPSWLHLPIAPALRRIRFALLACLSLLPACAPSPPKPAPAPNLPQQSLAPADASYDWHSLIVVPFGTVLKEVPFKLREVLLFRDETHGPTATDEPECYAIDGPPPRLLGRAADEYLLCFRHDRLSRITASIHVPASDAGQIFAQACSQWQKNAASRLAAQASGAPANAAGAGNAANAASTGGAPNSSSLAASSALGTAAAAGSGTGSCEGRDAGARFAAHPVDTDQPETSLAISIDSASDR